MSEPAAISLRNLTKSYGQAVAVNGISFDIAAGETFALLGPNGAGKTSTIEILEGYRKRSGGEVQVLGFDPGANSKAFRECIGIVLQSTALEPELTVFETISAFAQLYPRPARPDRLLEIVGLADNHRKRVKALSGGQQRRLEIAIGLVGNPDVIFLDEPTTGLDPDARNSIWELIRMLSGRGKTVLLTSHYMEEVEALADRLAIMAAGQICAMGSIDDIIHAGGGSSQVSFGWPHAELPYDAPALLGSPQRVNAQRLRYNVARLDDALPALMSWAAAHRIDLNSLTIMRPSLEEIYLSIVDNQNGQDSRRA